MYAHRYFRHTVPHHLPRPFQFIIHSHPFIGHSGLSYGIVKQIHGLKCHKSMPFNYLFVPGHAEMSWDLQFPRVRSSDEPQGITDLYEYAVTHVAAFVLSASAQEFTSVEQILIEGVLQPSVWRALMSMDIWCIMARYVLPSPLPISGFISSRYIFVCSMSVFTSVVLDLGTTAAMCVTTGYSCCRVMQKPVFIIYCPMMNHSDISIM